MTNVDPDEFLQGGTKVPAAKFATIGDTVVGTVVDRAVQQCRDFENNELESWPDGNPKLQLVITLQTDQRDPSLEDDDGKRRIYARKPSSMFVAIAEVTSKKGLKLLPGGRLAVRFVGEKPNENPRLNPIKQYVAQYRPPVVAAVDDLLAADAGGNGEDGAPQPAAVGAAADLLG